jgi:alpha-tubulin suppressor-like RCC1 family protein
MCDVYRRHNNTTTGQGKTVKKETANPLPILSLNNFVITQVSAGEKHSVVLAQDGSVLTFGSGSNGSSPLSHENERVECSHQLAVPGRLGHGDTKNQDAPRVVQGVFDKSCAIAAGFEHTIVLTGEISSDDGGDQQKRKSRKSSKASDLKSAKSSSKKLGSKSSKASGKGKG